jgi:hypothetical protein
MTSTPAYQITIPRTDAGLYVIRLDWTDATGERRSITLGDMYGHPYQFRTQPDAFDFAQTWLAEQRKGRQA